MQLRYIGIPLLIAEAGGDPWAIDQSLQAGRPAKISDLGGGVSCCRPVHRGGGRRV